MPTPDYSDFTPPEPEPLPEDDIVGDIVRANLTGTEPQLDEVIRRYWACVNSGEQAQLYQAEGYSKVLGLTPIGEGDQSRALIAEQMGLGNI